MSNETWIKTSDKPAPAGIVVWVSAGGGTCLLGIKSDGQWTDATSGRTLLPFLPAYWQVPHLPEPPKREQTQGDLDAAAWDKYMRDHNSYGAADVWHAALRQDREAIWAEWVKSPADNDTPFNNWLFTRCSKTEGQK